MYYTILYRYTCFENDPWKVHRTFFRKRQVKKELASFMSEISDIVETKICANKKSPQRESYNSKYVTFEDFTRAKVGSDEALDPCWIYDQEEKAKETKPPPFTPTRLIMEPSQRYHPPVYIKLARPFTTRERHIIQLHFYPNAPENALATDHLLESWIYDLIKAAIDYYDDQIPLPPPPQEELQAILDQVEQTLGASQ